MRSSFEVVKVMNRKSDTENLFCTVTADCEACSTKSTCGDDDGSSDLAASIDPNEKVGPLGWGDDHWRLFQASSFTIEFPAKTWTPRQQPPEVRMVDTWTWTSLTSELCS